MDGDVKKIKQIVQVPKIIIPAEGFLTDGFEGAELISVGNRTNTAIMKSFMPDGLDGAELIPVDLGGRLVTPSISINELGKQLLKASIEGNVDEIKLLMNKGAPFTADWLGTSPLHFAAQNNHLEVCEILLRAGISKDARTKVDRTPLHIATYEGHLEIVKCLLQNKADVDCKDLLAMTPLHWAAQNCHPDIAELLVQQGAQRDPVNKFNLTPVDIAMQCDRADIADIINSTIPDPDLAVQHLAIEMSEMDNSSDSMMYPPVETLHTEPNSPIPLETVLLEDIDSENSIDPERLHINQEDVNNYSIQAQTEPTPEETDNQNSKFSDSIKLLQQHGITMLPADDTNILSSILETGHSVVLTEVGKQVLNSTKPVQSTTNSISKITPKIKTLQATMKPKKVITMTPQEFLAMTLNQGDIFKQINGKLISAPKPTVKRIVMKKNKVVPITTNANVMKMHKQESSMSDVEILMKQLIDARKLVEEYKQKFLKKEAEAERYKQQLLLLAQSKNLC